MGKKKSYAWNCFNTYYDDKGQECQKCKYCPKTLKSLNNATKLRYHVLNSCKGKVPGKVLALCKKEENANHRIIASNSEDDQSGDPSQSGGSSSNAFGPSSSQHSNPGLNDVVPDALGFCSPDDCEDVEIQEEIQIDAKKKPKKING